MLGYYFLLGDITLIKSKAMIYLPTVDNERITIGEMYFPNSGSDINNQIWKTLQLKENSFYVQYFGVPSIQSIVELYSTILRFWDRGISRF